MKNKTVSILTSISVITVLLMPMPALSCGPFFSDAVFVSLSGTDMPLEEYAHGRLGIVLPGYKTSHLYVAYRYLAGLPLDKEEQKVMLSFWGEAKDYRSPIPDVSEAKKGWFDARSKVPGLPAAGEIKTYQQTKTYAGYDNCLADSFGTAARTLNKRIQTFGAGSPEMKAWALAQDAVFSNCSGGRNIIPLTIEPGLKAAIQKDRAYQIASAYFYAGDFDKAGQLFREIVKDQSSPWRPTAAYVVARIFLREATLNADYCQIDRAWAVRAKAELLSILVDSSLKDVHPAAQRMMDFLRFRLYPEERGRELDHALMKKGPPREMYQNIVDYTLFMRSPSWNNPGPLTDWVLTFGADGEKQLAASLKKWEETASLPWLVAVLTKIDANHPKLQKVLAAANAVDKRSPGYLTVLFHRTRLQMESGKFDEARAMIESALTRDKNMMSPSARNLFLNLRLQLARNLDEFLRDAALAPVAVQYGDDVYSWSRPGESYLPDTVKKMAGKKLLDRDAADILNKAMSLNLMKEAAQKTLLPVNIRRQLALAAWTRAVLVDDEKTALELAALVETLVPEAKEELKAYRSAESGAARKFAGIFLMLKYPGARPIMDWGIGRTTALDRIDDFRDNWWCALKGDLNLPNFLKPYYLKHVDSPEKLALAGESFSLAFVNDSEKKAGRDEWKKLSSIGTGPNYLGKQVIAWAEKHPDDPRVPEALHLAVKSTRYGCTDDDTSKISKDAFKLLHKQYPKSPWTKKTPYSY
ncbi:MAG: hypothetical protein AABZ10_05525 [Nitrospirota bacterium]